MGATHACCVRTCLLTRKIEATATGQRTDLYVMTTQVWRQRTGMWQQVSFQATNLQDGLDAGDAT